MNKFFLNASLMFWVCERLQMGKLGYKSVPIIRFLRVISIQTKLIHLVAQHQRVYKSEYLHTVLRDCSELNFARDSMKSGYPDHKCD